MPPFQCCQISTPIGSPRPHTRDGVPYCGTWSQTRGEVGHQVSVWCVGLALVCRLALCHSSGHWAKSLSASELDPALNSGRAGLVRAVMGWVKSE